MPRGRVATPAPERFARQTEAAPSGCIEWTGQIDRYGNRACRECRRMNDHKRKQAARNGHL